MLVEQGTGLPYDSQVSPTFGPFSRSAAWLQTLRWARAPGQRSSAMRDLACLSGGSPYRRGAVIRQGAQAGGY